MKIAVLFVLYASMFILSVAFVFFDLTMQFAYVIVLLTCLLISASGLFLYLHKPGLIDTTIFTVASFILIVSTVFQVMNSEPDRILAVKKRCLNKNYLDGQSRQWLGRYYFIKRNNVMALKYLPGGSNIRQIIENGSYPQIEDLRIDLANDLYRSKSNAN